jgi:hypothetical protein
MAPLGDRPWLCEGYELYGRGDITLNARQEGKSLPEDPSKTGDPELRIGDPELRIGDPELRIGDPEFETGNCAAKTGEDPAKTGDGAAQN